MLALTRGAGVGSRHHALTRAIIVGTATLSLAACGTPRTRDSSVETSDAPIEEASLDAMGVPALDAAPDAPAPADSPVEASLDVLEREGGADAATGDVESSVESCPMRGFTRCAGTCVDVTASAEHCGACGASCVAGANATAMCLAGECDRGCAAGFGDCDTNTANGCEADLRAAANCGACGRACASGESCSSGACVGFAALPPPTQLAPLSGARIGRRRPTLRWARAAGVTFGTEVQLCADRACSAGGATTVRVDGTTYSPGADLEARTYFWRLRVRDADRASDRWSPVWQFRVVPTGATSDVPSGFDADFNGDGRADVVVGAPEADSGKGAVYVYYGASGGPASATPSWTSLSPMRESLELDYGRALAAGDVNGDGFVDLVVGDPVISLGNGSVYVHFGAASGLSMERPLEIIGPRGYFGASLAVVPDSNGDGRADLLIGAPRTRYVALTHAGAAYVFQGSAGSAAPVEGWSIREMTAELSDLGGVVASPGDFDGDGRGDLYVGALGEGAARAYATVFLATATGFSAAPTVRYEEPGVDMGFASAGCALGDIHGDGFADVMVRVTPSELWVYRGGATGLPVMASQVLRRETFGEMTDGFAGGDDVNADGRADLVLTGACGAGVYLGSTAGFATEGAVRLMSPAGVAMGLCTANASMPGDVDGDGLGDVVVSSVDANGARGGVYLYLGRRAGVSATPAWSAQGPAAGAHFGETLVR